MNNLIDELSVISHEFKTPIDIISNTAQFIIKSTDMDKLSSDKLVSSMNSIRYYCYKLKMLTENILTLSKCENKIYDLRFMKCNLDDVMQKLKVNMQPYCETLNLDLSLSNKLKNSELCTDYNKLEIIILNFISNAIKYNDKDNIAINITLSDNKDNVFISIKDNGIGIPAELQDKVFEKFYRADSSLSKKTEGVGLGLTIVKSLINAINGTITIKSRIKKGTEFIISLPKDTLPTPSLRETDDEFFSTTTIAICLSGLK